MGSYLSIVNDTLDPWQCKIGPDEAALNIAGIVIGIVGSVATVIATAGAAAPLAAFLTSNGVVAVAGVSTSALASVAAGAAAVAAYAKVVGTVSGFGMAMAKVLADELNKEGYHAIAPGESYRSDRKTLSLWQQATCVKTVIVSEKTVRVETLYMRPIFTGATDNSNVNHNIQWWVNKWGTESQEIVAHGQAPRSLEEEEEPYWRAVSGTQADHA